MNRKRRGLALILSLALALTSVLAAPVTASAAEKESAKKTETTASEKTVSKKDAEKEAEKALIKKYGKYKGKNAKRIPVITYHIIRSDARGTGGSTLVITESNFKRQMWWLKSHGYRTINCDEMYLWHQGKIKLPKKTVMITFDDGNDGVIRYALPILKKYKMKGTCFVIGSWAKTGAVESATVKQIKKAQKKYSGLEFQSHTYAMHQRYFVSWPYKKIFKKTKSDVRKQNKTFDFDYLAYPFGYYSKGMINAYKKSGIKMAFTYGTNEYATRKQSLYKIRRIKIYGTGSFAQFKAWFR